ncbi:MAG: hypothetical protein JSS02_27125 [Planctomycetes bacterium]|nr:hypothetical protein [Planctomycetota bacterium]
MAVVALAIAGQVENKDLNWEGATDKATRGDITVAILSVRRGKAFLRHLREQTQSKEELLSVAIGIFNKSETKKYNYHGWSSKSFDLEMEMRGRASDELGNGYKRIKFDIFTKVAGQLEDGASIYPDKPLVDILVFELPVEKARELRLTLPGEAIDWKGPILLKVPIGSIDKDGYVYNFAQAQEEKERAQAIERRKAEARRQMEIEAKKTPEQKDLERKRASELAANKKAIAEKEKLEKDEKTAAAQLKAANTLLKEGKSEAYRKQLKRIVEKYPDTDAGKEAAKLLK